MIVFDFECDQGHRFESWFKNRVAKNKLLKAGAVTCSHCGSSQVTPQLAAPRLNRGAAAPASQTAAALPAPSATDPATMRPDQLKQHWLQLQKAIEKNCEAVGDKFAEEAIAMHQGHKPARNIYGRASRTDHERLDAAGVDYQTLPWLKSDA